MNGMTASFIKTTMQLIGIIKERVEMFEETKADYKNALEYLNSITGHVEELKKNPTMMQDPGLVNTISNLEKITCEIYKVINSWEGYSNIFRFLYCHDLAKKLQRVRNELQECLIAAEFGVKVALFLHITQEREHDLLPPQQRNRSQCAPPQDAGMVGSSSDTRSIHDYDDSDEAEQIGAVPAASNRPGWLSWLWRSNVAAAAQILLLITVVAVALQPRLALPCWANGFDQQCSRPHPQEALPMDLDDVLIRFVRVWGWRERADTAPAREATPKREEEGWRERAEATHARRERERAEETNARDAACEAELAWQERERAHSRETARARQERERAEEARAREAARAWQERERAEDARAREAARAWQQRERAEEARAREATRVWQEKERAEAARARETEHARQRARGKEQRRNWQWKWTRGRDQI
uniref:Uncharacterized protein n=1 Tax=Leersia perrieri TaxID=77586 RepID=A0A0D9XV34_9ORYZ